ncbi:MAG: EVE domain-containing protein [Candidatus Binatia bacterium]
MKTWLFKTEPSTYSFDDLRKEGKTTWDGVKNPQALRNLAQIEPGDRVLVYHTGDEKAVVGVARAVGEPRPDPRKKEPKLLVVDVEAVKPLRRPVTLAAIKGDTRFGGFDLVRLPRLSVMAVSDAQWAAIESLSKETEGP